MSTVVVCRNGSQPARVVRDPDSAGPRDEGGVSVQISQPGVYGRIDIGRFPQPQVVVAAPVIVALSIQATVL